MLDKVINLFDLDPEGYFELARPMLSPNGRTVSQNIARTEASMREIVERYALAGKSVLSLGPRFGHDEYWMWRAGCSLVMVDIDEQRDILPLLQRSPSGDGLRFVVADAFKWSEQQQDVTFDAVYTAGFGPQEVRRAELLRQGAWSDATEFYHPGVLELCRRHLRPGGLYINLSYYAGPSLTPPLIASMAAQLERAELTLVEIHAWRDMPAIHLDAASRGQNRPLAERLSRSAPMIEIHGRSELADRAVIRLFPEQCRR